MKASIQLAVYFTSIVVGQAYSPNPINRRIMIESSLTAMIMPPSLVIAKELNETLDINMENKSKDTTPMGAFDALGDFRIWRRRSSKWLERRLERERVAKQQKTSKSMETDLILSNKMEREKIQLFTFTDKRIDCGL